MLARWDVPGVIVANMGLDLADKFILVIRRDLCAAALAGEAQGHRGLLGVGERGSSESWFSGSNHELTVLRLVSARRAG